MLKILLTAVIFYNMSFTVWQTDFTKAKELAKSSHRLILVNFSGSDWCGPCIRIKKEFFDDSNFLKMADSSLVLVNEDFPRNKKNQLSTNLQKQNNALADKYNPEGIFPFTLLIAENGKVIKTWDGLPNTKVDLFSKQIAALCNANKK